MGYQRALEKGIKIIAYADDVVLLVRGRILSNISEVMERWSRKLSRWATRNRLKINPRKTELVLYTRRHKMPEFRFPFLDGITLQQSKEAKYYGIVLEAFLEKKYLGKRP